MPFHCALVCALSLLAGTAAPGVVAGTAHIQAIVETLTDAPGSVPVLIPPGMCPGHFDIRPGDIEAVSGGAALLIQDWQETMPSVKALVQAADLRTDRIHVIRVAGNWMVPEAQAEAVRAIADVLAGLDPDSARAYGSRADARVRAVQETGEAVRARLRAANPSEAPVLCHAMLRPVLEWAGFPVIDTFGGGEEASVASMAKLVRRAREQGVVLVVDNLQSGDATVGEALARDTGAARVVLTNFPGTTDDTATWEQALARNADALLDALARQRGRRDE